MHTRLPEGKPVIIDANIFLNAILGNATESAPCIRILEVIDERISEPLSVRHQELLLTSALFLPAGFPL